MCNLLIFTFISLILLLSLDFVLLLFLESYFIYTQTCILLTVEREVQCRIVTEAMREAVLLQPAVPSPL